MEFTKEQHVFQKVINEAWENETFKTELMINPLIAIEKLTGEKLVLPDGKTLVVRDQTNEETIYINIPAIETIDVELSETQLEAVAGGVIGDQCIEEPTIYVPTNPFDGIIKG